MEVQHLRKEYPGVVPLKEVNASIERGEVISIIGPSGTGKSTLLRCLNRLETPTSGRILVDGVDMCDPATDLYAMRRRIGMVFQSFNLFGHMLVVTHEMRFAREVSNRVFFMNEGVVWESGSPEQIFEHPVKPETYGFIFRVRNWVWELRYPDDDYPAMEGSLLEFCARQLLGRRLADACQHVVEELSAEHLPSLAREAGVSGTIATLRLCVPESGDKAVLEVDCRGMVERGVDLERLGAGSHAFSDALVAGYSVRVSSDDPAVVAYEIA
ncbi:MAG: amino acid ABC transporter ATP-binding protein [Atopobiaceae bacterium]|nr:amino acid ABC transporter ATP-binding protein [Atopobiaceae bacterium]